MPMDHHPNTLSFSLDDSSLYCNEEEEKWVVTEDDFADSIPAVDLITNTNETDPMSENEELLLSLLSKEKETHFAVSDSAIETDSDSRREAVEWILKVNGYYGFSTLTAILAVSYLDRFLASVHFQKDKPWVIYLASVTSLSLAAKVEETYVPLLLDFQVESKYVFEAKAIQKMELLMLSTLKWRMNVVTPLSFLEHIITRLGLKNGGGYWDFLRRCERLLLSVVADMRVVRYEASVLAASSMLHVIHEMEPCNAIDYHNKLLNLLKISEMKVRECSELISEIVSKSSSKKKSNKVGQNEYSSLKRKNNYVVPSSPNGVIDAFLCTTSDVSSNDSWAVSSLPFKKKIRIQEQQMRLPSLPLNNRLFLEIVGRPH